ncbi:hypothetical protein D3C72_2186040 [compost metagenome]
MSEPGELRPCVGRRQGSVQNERRQYLHHSPNRLPRPRRNFQFLQQKPVSLAKRKAVVVKLEVVGSQTLKVIGNLNQVQVDCLLFTDELLSAKVK